MITKKEEIIFDNNPRRFGKSYKAWLEFIEASKAGESAIYVFPGTKIYSQKAVDDYLAYGIKECMPDLKSTAEEFRNDIAILVETSNRSYNQALLEFKSNAKSKFNIEVK